VGRALKKNVVGLLFQHNQKSVKGFFLELQFKRVYRVAGGYIVSAWMVLQASLFSTRLGGQATSKKWNDPAVYHAPPIRTGVLRRFV
jgi:hypothetical protein